MNKLHVIDGIFESWLSLNKFSKSAFVSDNVKQINCDTRDFALGWNFEEPKSFPKASCVLEVESNKGLSKLYGLFGKSEETRKKYAINKADILKWLYELCDKTGGFSKDWRYLTADIKKCDEWDIKYIRFVRNNKNPDEFIVCNRYYFPVEYRKIISNLKEIS